MSGVEETSPQMAHSIHALVDRWSLVMQGYRFLTSAELHGTPAARDAERLLKVEHDGAALYPEFQFDEDGQVRTVILELISLAISNDWSEQSLVLWCVTATGFLDDEKPIDHLDDPERILAGARSRFEQSW